MKIADEGLGRWTVESDGGDVVGTVVRSVIAPAPYTRYVAYQGDGERVDGTFGRVGDAAHCLCAVAAERGLL